MRLRHVLFTVVLTGIFLNLSLQNRLAADEGWTADAIAGDWSFSNVFVKVPPEDANFHPLVAAVTATVRGLKVKITPQSLVATPPSISDLSLMDLEVTRLAGSVEDNVDLDTRLDEHGAHWTTTVNWIPLRVVGRSCPHPASVPAKDGEVRRVCLPVVVFFNGEKSMLAIVDGTNVFIFSRVGT